MNRALAAAVSAVLLAAGVCVLGTPDRWRRAPLGPTALALGVSPALWAARWHLDAWRTKRRVGRRG